MFNRKTDIDIKSVPTGVGSTDIEPRNAIDKLYLPLFLFKPPFGWPRNQNIPAIRRLAQTPQAAMGMKAILDVVDTIPWDIVPKEGFEEDNETTKSHIKEVKAFFLNPNDTKETFSQLQRRVLRDTIEINSGIIAKGFNLMGDMVEMRPADGATFLMNPDRHGKFTDRDELILTKNIFAKEEPDKTEFNGHEISGVTFAPDDSDFLVPGLSVFEAQEKAAYFQFPWSQGTGGKPVPFGIREIVWLQDNPTTNSIYGISIFENILSVLQTLVYLLEFHQDFFEDNNVPKGMINLPGATQDGIDDFTDRWNDSQMVVNRTGQVKKASHRIPITNFEGAEFVRIQFTAEEIDFIATTKLFSQLVWGMLGLNASEVGFTEDSNRAVDLVQDKKFMRKAILPRLKNLAEKFNQEVISEFEFEDVEFKYIIQNIDDDTAKANMYKTILDAGWRTVNEIRKLEGLEPIDGGDELPQKQMSFSGEGFNPFEKPNPQKEMEDAKKKQNKEQKALTGDRADNLGEFEVLGSLRKILNDAKKKLLDLTRANVNQKRTSINQKSLDRVVGAIDNLFSAEIIRSVVDQVIKDFYRKGNDKAEKQLDMNLIENPAQIKALADMTFDNIKGMTEDLKNKLRGILQRALVSGKGIGTISDEIKAAFDLSTARADTIARTETTRAEQSGQLSAMKSSGVDVRKYILIIKDKVTTEVSFAMDRKYGSVEKSIPLNDLFSVVVNGKSFEGQAPPFMPNDRDEVLYVLKDDFDEELEEMDLDEGSKKPRE